MPDTFRFSYYITSDSPTCPEIWKLGERMTLMPGAQLSNIGEKLTRLYYIVKGELALSVISADGRERICMFIRNNMFYGEAHLYREFPTLFRVFATTETVLLFFSLRRARALIDSNPAFRIALLNGQSQKISSMTGELVSLVIHTPEERVLNCLRDMAENTPVRHGGREVQISQQDIARILGLHRITVNKALASLKEQGHILYGRGRVMLLDQ